MISKTVVFCSNIGGPIVRRFSGMALGKDKGKQVRLQVRKELM